MTGFMGTDRSQTLFKALFLLFAAAITIPDPLIFSQPGLDPAWIIALHKARMQGLTFGKDIVFTSGPLGFIKFPLLIDWGLWLQSVAYNSALFALFASGLYLFAKEEKIPWNKSLYLVSSAWLFTGWFVPVGGLNEGTPIIALLMFAHLYYKRGGLRYAALLGAVTGLQLFIKFSAGLSAISILAMLAALLLFRKRWRDCAEVAASTLVSVGVLAALLFGSVDGFVSYLAGSLALAGGYDSMSSDGERWQLAVAVIAWIVYFGIIVRHYLNGETAKYPLLVLSAGMLFMAFKHGFVRHDAPHVHDYFATWLMVFSLYHLSLPPGKTPHRTAALYLSGAFFAILFRENYMHIRHDKGHLLHLLLYMMTLISLGTLSLSPLKAAIKTAAFRAAAVSALVLFGIVLYIAGHKTATAHNVTAGWASLTARLISGKEINPDGENNANLSGHYKLAPETAALLKTGGVDFIPWDSTIADVNKLRWNPRPIFQSYTAYSEYLDGLNAGFYQSEKAPEFVLIAVKSLDERYPMFDGPATFQSLLRNYRPVVIDGENLVLKKGGGTAYEKTPLSETETSFGGEVEVPRAEGGHLFARIYLGHNLAGKMAKFVYKAPQTQISLFSEGAYKRYRFIPSLAPGGIFLSRNVESAGDIMDVWRRAPSARIEKIRIDAGNAAFFEKRITVRFYTLRAAPKSPS